jgi:CIC family chloride channel protein
LKVEVERASMSPVPTPRERGRALFRQVQAMWARPAQALGPLNLFSGEAPIDLRIAGRVLLHAGLVGLAAGLLGAAFFAALEIGQRILLQGVAGFSPILTGGEVVVPPAGPTAFRPWLLALLPAIGGLASGLATSVLAPEAAGGGGDAAIEAYHHGGVIRRRVIPVKGLAAFLALSSGGSGGREGPTMQIGAAIGAAVGRVLPTSRAERRVLLVAGIAAGISAVFRTPLGAALLATELLYRDDFEANALVPSIFASVVSYSVVIALFGETRLFGHLPPFPFTPGHLPLYGLVAVAVSLAALLFIRVLRAVQARAARLPGPAWLRPAVGGLLMGAIGTALALWMEWRHGAAARGFGVFGGGYGALQVAMTGADWLPGGTSAVGLLVGVALLKVLASALTIGSGAAAGDFAPSLVIGGLVGGAFGHAARLLLGDPSIDPSAFALVGMGTFYGGLAHAPLAALVLVAELAGSYDLLVPMMLAIGIASVALRRHSLYPAQRPSRSAPRGPEPAPAVGEIARAPAHALVVQPELGDFPESAPLADVAAAAEAAERQRVVLVRGAPGPRGLLELALVAEVPPSDRSWMRAGDVMVPFASVGPDATWAEIAEALERRGLSQLPVVQDGEILGWVGDRELRRALLARSEGAERSPVRDILRT